MAKWKSKLVVVSVFGACALSGVAEAQDPEQGEMGAYGEVSTSGSASYGGSSSGGVSADASSGSSFYLELQGRLDAFNVAGVEGLSLDSGTGGGTLTAPAIPFVTAGVRLLEGDLFVGLGFGFAQASRTTSGPAPAGDVESSRGAFMLVPVATYDFLGEGPAALYGLGMLKLGAIGSGEDDGGPDVESGFWWGLNLGVGIRGDITEYVSAFSELGWGFSHGSWEAGDIDNSRFVHGLFGTLGLAVRVGL
jgi:hypothetical protein